MKQRAWLGEVYNNGAPIFGPLAFFADTKELARDHLLHCALFAQDRSNATVRLKMLGWFEDGKLPPVENALKILDTTWWKARAT